MEHRLSLYLLLPFLHWCTFIAPTYGMTPHATITESIALEGCTAVINQESNGTRNRFTFTVTKGNSTHLGDSKCLEVTHTEALRLIRDRSNQSGSTHVRITSLNHSAFQYECNYGGYVAGKIVALEIENIDLSRSSGFLDSLRNLTQLQQLSLVNTNLTTIPNGLFEKLIDLQKLVITGNHLTELPSQVFSGLRQLQELILSSNQIEELHEDIFSELVSLRELYLNKNKIRSNLSTSHFVENKNLTILNLAGYKPNGGKTIGITDKIFRENRNLETLNLANNDIGHMHPEIFANLNRLKHLDISSNIINNLDENWFRDFHSLETLILFGNLLVKNLNPLKNLTKLRYLDANWCGVTNLTNATFASMIELETVMLFGNRIPSGEKIFYNNSKLKIIKLSDISSFNPNWFTDLPLLELVKLSSKDLQELYYKDLFLFASANSTKNVTFDFTDVHLLELFFRSAEKVRRINYSNTGGRVLINIPKGSIANNSCDADYIRDYMSSRQHDVIIQEKEVTPRQKKSAERKDRKCFCEDNESPCLCYYNVTRKAIDLNCSKIKAHTLAKELEHQWPSLDLYLNYTIKLDLSQNKLKSLPKINEWEFVSRIVTLNISNNNLNHQALETIPFEKFKQLSILDLRKNQLNQVPLEFLTAVANSSAVRNFTLFLDENPLKCNCSDLAWLTKFASVVNESDAVADFENLTCNKSEGNVTYLSQALLGNLTDENHIENICRVPAPPYKLSYVEISICIVFAVICILIVCWLMKDRFNRFAKSHFKKNIQMESQAPLLKYDAFISYSHKDEEFVINELVPNLENPSDGSPKYRLCLHERDWLAGEWILDQINQSIATSHRTIIVLSENFIESFWGKHEFRVAYQQVIQSKQRRLIVVIKDEVPDLAPLDEDLRHFIANNTYLKWSDSSFWRRLREALPTNQVFATHPCLKPYDKNSLEP